ncbi:hypothetical protein HSB1_37680 [Halogranum salarium B-1]|uniref:Uncharacterized protein n=1 Tax=Halogranum salarium B-1 TaxID=1210908 RepID=J3JEG7_9EURY|nr:hypothetical protein HSB1_37680 [Halogranum salarium B-1]
MNESKTELALSMDEEHRERQRPSTGIGWGGCGGAVRED